MQSRKGRRFNVATKSTELAQFFVIECSLQEVGVCRNLYFAAIRKAAEFFYRLIQFDSIKLQWNVHTRKVDCVEDKG
jgi:hypothetical protein